MKTLVDLFEVIVCLLLNMFEWTHTQANASLAHVLFFSHHRCRRRCRCRRCYLNSVSSFWCRSLLKHPYKWYSRGALHCWECSIKRNTVSKAIRNTSHQFARHRIANGVKSFHEYIFLKCVSVDWHLHDFANRDDNMHWTGSFFMHLIATAQRIIAINMSIT